MSRSAHWILLVATACSANEPGAAPGRGDAGEDAGPRESGAPASTGWKTVFSNLPGALFSVWGTSERDVWVVGSDTRDGKGPLTLQYDGDRWLRRRAAPTGDLWWVHGFETGPVFMGGSNGTILRFERGRFDRVPAPRTNGTVFGIWGSDPSHVWAVGGDVLYGTGAFVWRLVGDRFEDAGSLPIPEKDVIAYFKVWGTSERDVWFVGAPGLSMHFDGAKFERVDPGVPDPLFTVHARPAGDRYATVGGADLGVLLERGADTPWSAATVPSGTRTLFGVWLTADGGYAVGDDGTVLTRASGAWKSERTGLAIDKGLHSVWVDPTGDVWAAGGDIGSPPYGSGVLIHRGKTVSGVTFEPPIADATTDTGDARSEAGTDSGPVPPDARDARADVAGDATGDADGAPADARADAPPPGDAHADTGPPPRTIACGAVSCVLPNEICCADVNTGVPVGCVASGTPCPGGQAPVSCDDPSDCATGFSCCLNRRAQAGPLDNVECEPACFGPAVCQSTTDCGGGDCTVFRIMPSYMICLPPPPP